MTCFYKSKSLALITKNNQLIAGGNLKNFSGFCGDYNLAFITNSDKAKKMLTLWRDPQSKIIFRLIICQVVKRDAENICQLFAFVQVGNAFTGLPFSHRLAGNTKLFCNIFLSQL